MITFFLCFFVVFRIRWNARLTSLSRWHRGVYAVLKRHYGFLLETVYLVRVNQPRIHVVMMYVARSGDAGAQKYTIPR